jgi:NADPH-dependent glutamate synthase beta subunit-like oxidoreductase/Pyruvate/2-oxoacid:ferredoxin oxidoreductase delta subunit
MRPEFGLKAAACAAACPAGNPIAKFMSAAADGRIEEALRALKSENPLPGVCGRVCPRPCEAACNRAEFDEAVGTRAVERLLGDAEAEFGLCLPAPASKTGKRVAVVGGGPAGLSCAYHLALSGHGATVFEAGSEPGGLLRFGIPAYRLPREVLDRELGFVGALGINMKTGSRVDAGGAARLLEEYDAVVAATGALVSPGLGIDGEGLAGYFKGLEFLAAANAGNAAGIGKSVIVVGGGNTAVDAARCALRLGAEDVTVMYRRGREDMPASDEEVAEAEEEGVKFEFYEAPAKLVGEGGKLVGAVVIRMKPGEPDESGRRRPAPEAGSERDVRADSVIEAAGGRADNPFGSALEVDDWGATGNKKLFVCGDAAPGARTVANAIGGGKRAAIRADVFLRGLDFEAVKRTVLVGGIGAASAAAHRAGESAPGADGSVVRFKNVNTAYFSMTARAAKVERLSPEARVAGFEEASVVSGNASEIARAEASRCFRCGECDDCGNCLVFCPDMSIIGKAAAEGAAPGFDGDYCKGCGICARECPRGVIEMIEEER